MRDQLEKIDDDISKKLLDIEGNNLKHMDITFIDVDDDGNLTFSTISNIAKNFPRLDIGENDKTFADYIYRKGNVYTKSRNKIKVGRLINKIFKGTLRNTEVENFVNSFKASSKSLNLKISIVSGDEIKYWYRWQNYLENDGNLGTSCMRNVDESFFNIYSQNPDVCRLLIMTKNDKLVARALLWKLNSIKCPYHLFDKNPQFFLDRIYSIEDYQATKMKNYALDQGWLVKRYTHKMSDVLYGNSKSYNAYEVHMSVKVKKSNYGNIYPYLDTFRRYEYYKGILWNDLQREEGGHVLNSIQGGYERGISTPRRFINKFKNWRTQNN